MRRRIQLLALPLLVLTGGHLAPEAEARRGPGGRVRPRPPRPRARPAGPTYPAGARLIVQDVPPAIPKASAASAITVTPRRRRRSRRYGSVSRSTTPVYLQQRPGGKERGIRFTVGTVIKVLKAGREWTRVESLGAIRVSGYVPSVVLGLRTQKKLKMHARPYGPSIGELSSGMMVHVERFVGAFAQIRLVGFLPVRCYVKRAELGLKPTGHASTRGKHPGGSAMVVSAGNLHARPRGAVVGRALDEGRIYRVRVLGRWSLIAMYDYSRTKLEAWVPTDRLRWGGYPSFSSGYRRYNCKSGRSGSQAALAEFSVYAALDDAFPTVRILAGARFNVSNGKRGWKRIYTNTCLYFHGYAEDRPGDWTAHHLIRRRR